MCNPEDPIPTGQRWTSVLAVLSSVLGLPSVLAGPLTGIPSIICGHIALSRIRRSDYAVTGEGLAKTGLVLGYVGTALWVLIFLVLIPEMSRVNEAVMRAACQNNLKELGGIIKTYKAEHGNGQYPKSIAELYPEYLPDPNILVCPASGHEVGDPATMDQWMDYEYTPPPDGAADGDTVILQDNEPFHMPKGRNKGYADGHVQFLREAH